MQEMEALRMLMLKRGNVQDELSKIGDEASEGTELQTVTLFKLMKAFEKVAQRLHNKRHQPVHTVVQYNYTMEESREYMLELVKRERTISFEKIFEFCKKLIHAMFFFLTYLELIPQNYF